MKNRFAIALIVAFLLVSTLAFADATVEITFTPGTQDFRAYDCLDNNCSQVQSFSGSFPYGIPLPPQPNTLHAVFPTTFPTGVQEYLMVFTSPNYLPKEVIVTYHGTGTTTQTIQFNKISSCKSPIIIESVEKISNPGTPLTAQEPLRINTTIASALTSTPSIPENRFHPPEFKNQFYSTNTNVTLLLLQNGITISSHEVLLTNNTNNPIPTDTIANVSFIVTPPSAGEYTLEAHSNVQDEKCALTIEEIASRTITILNGGPPTFTTSSNQSMQRGDTLTFSVSAVDPDGEPITYNSSNTLLPIDSTTGIITANFSMIGNITTIIEACTTLQECSETSITVSSNDTIIPNILFENFPISQTYHNTTPYRWVMSINDSTPAMNLNLSLNGTIVPLTFLNLSQIGLHHSLTGELVLPTLAAGIYSFQWAYSDDVQNNNSTILQNITISKASPQVNLTTTRTTNITTSTTINATCTVTPPHLTTSFLLGMQNVNTNFSDNLSTGNHTLDCSTLGNTNYTSVTTSQNISVVPTFSQANLSISEENIVFGTTTNATCDATPSFLNRTLSIDTQNVDTGVSINLSAGNHTFTCFIPGTTDYTSSAMSRNVSVNKTSSQILLEINGTSGNITVNTGSTIPINGTLITPDNGVGELLIRDPLTTNIVPIPLFPISTSHTFTDSGVHNVTISFLGDNNHTPSEVMYTVTVVDGIMPNITSTIESPSSGSNYSEIANYSFNASINDNIALDTIVFTFDGITQIITNTTRGEFTVNSSSITAGLHTFQWFANDTSGNSITSPLTNYTILRAIPSLNLTTTPKKNVTFGELTTTSCAVDTSQLSLELLFGSVITTNPHTPILDAGMYTYTCNTLGNTNYTSATASHNVSVAKAASNITVLLNGTDGNIAIRNTTTIDISANITTPSQDIVTLFIDNQQIISGTDFVSVQRNFPVEGNFTVNAFFAGNNNYHEGNISRIIFVTEPIVKTNIDPITGTFTNSSFNISFDTTKITSCRYDTNDVDISSMRGFFTTANGLHHTGRVFIPRVGVQSLHIGCGVDTRDTNLDMSFTIDNVVLFSTIESGSSVTGSLINNSDILSNSTLINSSIIDSIIDLNSSLINVTSVDNSIRFTDLRNVIVNESIITNSSLTNCIVRNANVKGIIATNCRFENATVDPPSGLNDLTGSTITGGSVIMNSNVTFSMVDTSTIFNSIVNNSIITNSSNIYDSTLFNTTISRSILEDVLTSGAVIENDIILTGSLNGTTFYNATMNGPIFLPNITNYRPIARFTTSKITIIQGESIQFTSTSNDTNIDANSTLLNDSLSFFYDFDDGTNSTDKNPSHTFAQEGTRIVNLTVKDSFNKTDSFTFTINVNVPPTTSNNNNQGGGGSSSTNDDDTFIHRPRTITAELNDTAQTFEIRKDYKIRFTINNIRHDVRIHDIQNDKIQFFVDTISGSATEGETKTIAFIPSHSLEFTAVNISTTTLLRSVIRLRLLNSSLALDNVSINDSIITTSLNDSSEILNITADIKPSFFGSLWNSITGAVSFDGNFLDWRPSMTREQLIGPGIIALIVILGLLTYFIVIKLFD